MFMSPDTEKRQWRGGNNNKNKITGQGFESVVEYIVHQSSCYAIILSIY